MVSRPVFPFSALVGQDLMKKSLALNAVNPRIGGVLIRGERGTAKSTAVRAFAGLLPEITAVQACAYSCDPDTPAQCPDCDPLRAAGRDLPTIRRPVRVVELPVGATEDRIIGTLNLERAIKDGERIFEPGLLAAANRGILYVDEVNLLNDHLVDVLLDAGAMGQNYVEREGISSTHPAQFLLVGTMNPEEGDLRPQLLDRFALAVEVKGLSDPRERAEVVRRRIGFETDPEGFVAAWQAAEEEERRRIIAARALLPAVTVPDELLTLISHICADFGVDGLRGDIVMYKTALALAAYAGRREVTVEDIEGAAELALLHRRHRQPFDHPENTREDLESLLRQHSGAQSSEGSGDSAQDAPKTDLPEGSAASSRTERIFDPGVAPPLRPLDQRPQSRWQMRQVQPAHSRGCGAQGEARAGGYVRARVPIGDYREIGNLALDATLRAAAPLQPVRRLKQPQGPRLRLLPGDVREKVREAKIGKLVLFLVDASGSMAARQRMAAVKGVVLSFLADAHRKRDRVGLISFRGDAARILLPPTNSVALAERQLRSLPTGGRTPLAHALQLGYELAERRQNGSGKREIPWLIMVSDGHSNVPLHGGDPHLDACRVAQRIREGGIRALVIDSEAGPVRLGLNRRLAEALGAEYVHLDQVGQDQVEAAVRYRLDHKGRKPDTADVGR